MSKKPVRQATHKTVKKKTPAPSASPFSGASGKAFGRQLILILQIAALCVVFGIVYNYIFDKKVNVNGDNAGYYLLGKSIHEGKGYTYANDVFKRPTDTYPPGYPFILSILMFLSEDITFLSVCNGFLLLGTLILLIFLFKRLEIPWQLSFATVVFLLFNYHIAGYAITTLSEVPYLFFSVLSLLAMTALDTSKSMLKDWRFYVLILLLVATYYVRSTGLALLAGVVFYLLTRKRWLESGVMTVAFLALASLWIIRGKVLDIPSAYREAVIKVNPYRPELGKVGLFSPVGDSITKRMSENPKESFTMVARVGENFNRYFTKEIPSGLLPSILVNYKEPAGTGSILLGAVFVLLMAYGLYRLPKYRWLILAYFAATFGILLLWPQQWFGTRFMMSLLPFMTLLVLYALYDLLTRGMKQVNLKMGFPALLFLPLLYLYIYPIQEQPADNQNWQSYPLQRLHYTGILDYQPNWRNFFNIAKWAKENLPKDAVVANRKPELFHLVADRYSCYFPSEKDPDKFIEGLKRDKVTHVVIDQLGFKSTGDYLVPAVNGRPQYFKPLQQLKEPDTWLMEFIPNPVQ